MTREHKHRQESTTGRINVNGNKHYRWGGTPPPVGPTEQNSNPVGKRGNRNPHLVIGGNRETETEWEYLLATAAKPETRKRIIGKQIAGKRITRQPETNVGNRGNRCGPFGSQTGFWVSQDSLVNPAMIYFQGVMVLKPCV